MNMLFCVLKTAKYVKQRTRTSYIDPFKAATIYLIQKLVTWLQLFRVVYLAWATNFGFAARLSNPQIFTQKIFSHFATSWGFIYLEKQFQSFENLGNTSRDWAKIKYKKVLSRHWTGTRNRKKSNEAVSFLENDSKKILEQSQSAD